MPSVRYRYEVKRIQSWILATNQLAHLAGGSQIVEEVAVLARKLAAQCGGAVEQAAAGAGTIVFDSEADMQKFASVWPLMLDLHAPGVTVVQAGGADDDALFGELASTPRLIGGVHPVAAPWVARAGLSGQVAVPGRAKRGGRLDAASARKGAVYKNRKRAGLGEFADLLDGLPGQKRFDEDVDQWSCSYVGVIHADGNAIGQMFQGISDADIKRHLSLALQKITREALASSLARMAHHEYVDSRGEHTASGLRARPIVVGGDDMTVIVPGPHAIPFAHYYLGEIERLARKEADGHENASVASALRGLTASAGVAVVKKKWPFHQAHAIAEALCKRAKKLTRNTGSATSALAFHRHTTSMTVDIDTPGSSASLVYGQLQGCADSPDETVLLQRLAWTTAELEALFGLIEVMRELPRGKMRQYLTEKKHSSESAQQLWQRTATVAVGKQPRVWRNLQSQLMTIDALIHGGTPQMGQRGDTTRPLLRDSTRLDKQAPWIVPIGDALAWMALRENQVETRLWTGAVGGDA